MNKPESAILRAQWGTEPSAPSKDYPVQFNPTELSLDKGVQLAEINIPGLDTPLQQFVRGQAEKLTVELFFDTTEGGMGEGATSVTTHTDEIYKLAKIEASSHAPPIVTFIWNAHFPGDSLPAQSGGQLRNSFTGVVENVKQQFTLFSPEGVPLRAKVTLVLREYRTLEEQLAQLNLNSPDRSHSHVLKRGEQLWSVAARHYRRAHEWRRVADENAIQDPRRLTPGTFLTVPVIE